MLLQPSRTASISTSTGQLSPIDRGRPLEVKFGNIVRWGVERTLAWLGRCRRLSKHVENLTRTALAMLRLAMIRLMMRRIARLQMQQ